MLVRNGCVLKFLGLYILLLWGTKTEYSCNKMGSHMLLLNWTEHKSNVIGEFQQLFSRSELTDVTLACDGFSLQAHKTVLSVSSAFFRNLFLRHPCNHAFVILTDVDSDGLKAIVEFMYKGQIHIPHQKLAQFLNTAEKLKIKGLSSFSQDESHNSSEEPTQNTNSRNEPMEHTDNFSEKQPLRSHSVDYFQTNENKQTELNLNSEEEVIHDSSASYIAVRNESCEFASHEPECSNTNISQPDLSPLLRDILASSNEISETQFQATLMESASQETLELTPPKFPKDKSRPSTKLQSKPEKRVTEATTESTLSGTQQPSNSNEMEDFSTFMMHMGNSTINATTTRSSSESSKSGGSNIRSFKIAETPAITETRDKPFFTHSSLQHLVCTKTFITESKLLAHQKTHAEEQPLWCTVCNKKFRQKHGLKFHMMAHFGEKPYSCNFCNRKFCRPYSLTVHRRIHTGEKPFSCTYCGKRFSDKSNLIVHLRVNH